MYLFKGFIFVIGLVGNGIVVTVITALRLRGQKSSVQLFLLHLAISDLMVCLLGIPLTFFTNFHYPTEYHTSDSGLCKLARFTQVQCFVLHRQYLGLISFGFRTSQLTTKLFFVYCQSEF